MGDIMSLPVTGSLVETAHDSLHEAAYNVIKDGLDKDGRSTEGMISPNKDNDVQERHVCNEGEGSVNKNTEDSNVNGTATENSGTSAENNDTCSESIGMSTENTEMASKSESMIAEGSGTATESNAEINSSTESNDTGTENSGASTEISSTVSESSCTATESNSEINNSLTESNGTSNENSGRERHVSTDEGEDSVDENTGDRKVNGPAYESNDEMNNSSTESGDDRAVESSGNSDAGKKTDIRRWQLSKFFDESIITDITLNLRYAGCLIEPFPAHRLVLVSRSPVFCRMLSENQQSVITLENEDKVEPFVFKRFLRYLYEDAIDANTAGLAELILLANKYEVPGLKSLCRELIKPVNACSLLEKRSVYKWDYTIIDDCLRCVSLNTRECFKYLGNVHRDTLKMVLEVPSISCSELVLFDSCYQWAEKQCGSRASGDDLREKLGTLLHCIRLPNLTPVEFCKVAETEILNRSDEAAIWRYVTRKATGRRGMDTSINRLSNFPLMPNRVNSTELFLVADRKSSQLSSLKVRNQFDMEFRFSLESNFPVWIKGFRLPGFPKADSYSAHIYDGSCNRLFSCLEIPSSFNHICKFPAVFCYEQPQMFYVRLTPHYMGKDALANYNAWCNDSINLDYIAKRNFWMKIPSSQSGEIVFKHGAIEIKAKSDCTDGMPVLQVRYSV